MELNNSTAKAGRSLVGRPHRYEVTYEVVLDTQGPLHYRVFCNPDDKEVVRDQIERWVGVSNIKELYVDSRGKHDVAIELHLVSDIFINTNEIYEVSPMSVEDLIKEALPYEHVVSVSVTGVIDLDAFGWHR